MSGGIWHYTLDGVPPSNNRFIGRTNFREYQREKKVWAERVFFCCRPRPEKPLPRARVTLTYFFPDRRRRDPDNYAGKMLLDGLTSARILQDDSFGNIELVLRAQFGCKTAKTQIDIEELTA